jgi:hypothetical protein
VLGLHFRRDFGHLVRGVESVRLHFAAVGDFARSDDDETAVS